MFPVSHNPAIIIIPYDDEHQVGNYSLACFTLLVLPDLPLKCNSDSLHRKYRARSCRQALGKGLHWLLGKGPGMALEEMRHLREPLKLQAVSWRASILEAALLPRVFKQGGEAALCEEDDSRQFTKPRCRERICQKILSSGVLRLVIWGILFFFF